MRSCWLPTPADFGYAKACVGAGAISPLDVAQLFTGKEHRASVFRVPPSLRQAAGPLIGNLPNVFAGDRTAVVVRGGDRKTVGSLESPSIWERKRCLSSRRLTTAAQERFLLRATAKRSSLLATAKRLTTQRGDRA
jgi:hypothetical protein